MSKIRLDPAEMAELRPVFVAESEQYLAHLEETLVALEGGADEQRDLSSAMRAMHTLKGSAGMLGLGAISDVAHAGEDLFAALRSGEAVLCADVVSSLLAAMDAIRSMVAAVEGGGWPEPGGHAELLAELVGHCGGTPPRAPEAGMEVGRREEARGRSEAEGGAPDGPETEPPGEPSGARAPRGASRRTLRVDVAKLDRLVDLVNEIILERRSLALGAGSPGADAGHSLRDAMDDGHHILDELRETIMALRLVPLGATLRRFARPIRDISAATGKEARLIVEGEDVEVDTSIAEAIVEPLTHLLRNAMDHGIESRADRLAAGKDPAGTIVLRARQQSASVLIEVEDDGGGLPRAKLIERALEWAVPDAERLSDPELRALIFESGFTTAAAVSDLSGRGVGMDIVRRMVEALRGTVELTSQEGRGTTVALRLPLTVSTIDGLHVSVDEGTYIVPMDSIVECVEAPQGAREDHGLLDLRGETLPYVRLRAVFGHSAEAPSREHVLIVRHGPTTAGLLVDRLLGQSETMIRPLDPRLGSRLSGSTVLEDGRVGLILDVPTLLQQLSSKRSTRDITVPAPRLN
jgi:two-component system chemotaxis sensor kinase CheA